MEAEANGTDRVLIALDSTDAVLIGLDSTDTVLFRPHSRLIFFGVKLFMSSRNF
ncbi:MAG: hypothetical protein BMS9Abin05_2390 [Rhodothermia bacterium]|nr:MAG: hypothetical protein BMS9Abin05_2390 [Rhodothermia bacterium]